VRFELAAEPIFGSRGGARRERDVEEPTGGLERVSNPLLLARRAGDRENMGKNEQPRGIAPSSAQARGFESPAQAKPSSRATVSVQRR
jgi:hypothetical protein